MPHKTDRKRQKFNIINKVRKIKQKYLKLTRNDSIEPDRALAELKDSDQVELAKRLAAKLARRGVFVRFLEER